MIALFGGGGFIGRALAHRLTREGRRVRVIGRSPSADPPAGAEQRQADLADAGSLRAALEGCATLVHLASTSVPGTAGRDPVADAAENVAGGVRLFEAARETGVRRIVFLSSGGAVYGRAATIPTPEGEPLRPMGAYGAAKAALEAYLCAWASGGLRATVLRLSNVYGPGQSPTAGQGVVAAFGRRVLDGDTVELWGDGAVVRDYLFLDDAVDALAASLEWDDPGFDVWNVGSGRGASTLEVLSAVERAAGLRARVRRSPARPYDVPVSILDAAKLRARGWLPRVDLEAGVGRTIDAEKRREA